MRKTVLYIAMSLDGYIGDANGGVAWLQGDGSEKSHPGSYPEFLDTIDTVVLGRTTYDQLVTELSPEKWVYPDKMTYVITHRPLENTPIIRFTDDLFGLIDQLKARPGRDIWICGGATIVNELLNKNMIDRLVVTVIPTLLGGGIRLFDNMTCEMPLKLIGTTSYNGMTDLVYQRR